MKSIVICILFAVSLTCCLADEKKRCKSREDCDDGQCCIARSLFGFAKGECKDLAQLGNSCNPEEQKIFSRDEYFLHCPCAPGLSCEPSDVKDIPFIGTVKIDERCVEGATTVIPEQQTDSIPEE